MFISWFLDNGLGFYEKLVLRWIFKYLPKLTDKIIIPKIVPDIVNNQFYGAECYIHGTSLAVAYNYCNGEKSDYTYYVQNAHGDVVNLTDADGAVIKSDTYDAFGVEKNIDDADTNDFRYCGEYFDTETGTVYLRARYYNLSTGRFKCLLKKQLINCFQLRL